MSASKLPPEERLLPINLLENGFLVAIIWDRAKEGDPLARSIYLKLKTHAKLSGVDWYYGDPWPIEEAS